MSGRGPLLTALGVLAEDSGQAHFFLLSQGQLFSRGGAYQQPVPLPLLKGGTRPHLQIFRLTELTYRKPSRSRRSSSVVADSRPKPQHNHS